MFGRDLAYTVYFDSLLVQVSIPIYLDLLDGCSFLPAACACQIAVVHIVQRSFCILWMFLLMTKQKKHLNVGVSILTAHIIMRRKSLCHLRYWNKLTGFEYKCILNCFTSCFVCWWLFCILCFGVIYSIKRRAHEIDWFLQFL